LAGGDVERLAKDTDKPLVRRVRHLLLVVDRLHVGREAEGG